MHATRAPKEFLSFVKGRGYREHFSALKGSEIEELARLLIDNCEFPFGDAPRIDDHVRFSLRDPRKISHQRNPQTVTYGGVSMGECILEAQNPWKYMYDIGCD